MFWSFLRLKRRNTRLICSKISGTAKYLVKKSLMGRTEERKDKQMTRNFIGDCKTLLNILCPVRNNIE